MKRRIVVFTGAGISAESGISTFRDNGGLWEQYKIEDVATPEAFHRNPELVINFYNLRRKQVLEANPNDAHLALVELEKKFNVNVITQNIDDLHERAGSSNVLHLHGEIRKARSTANPSLIYEIDGWELKLGQLCVKGSQLRPHIVWFGEMVPAMSEAELILQEADILIIIGTSLNVYPAAGLVNLAPSGSLKIFIDPNATELPSIKNIKMYNEKAGTCVPLIVKQLLNDEY